MAEGVILKHLHFEFAEEELSFRFNRGTSPGGTSKKAVSCCHHR